MSEPKHTITLYMPSFNQAPMLSLAIESVLAQTRRPDQFIIIDDASTDDSPDVIRSYERQHPDLITAVLNPINTGIGAVRNQAITLAHGDLVTYLDGDDLYEPQKLEFEERTLDEHPDAGYAYSNMGYIDQRGNETGVWYEDAEELPQGDQFSTIARYAFAKGMCHRCELMRTSLVRAAGSYEPGLNLYEDYDLKLRVSRHHPGVAVDRITQRYRIHDGGLHRASYARHFDALNHIYTKNAPLIDSLEEPERSQVRAAVGSTLARCAWRAVKQAAKGYHPLPNKEIQRYASLGYRLEPKKALHPKHIYRVIRALGRAPIRG